MNRLYKILITCLMLIIVTNVIMLTENKAATYSFSFTGPTQANNGDTLTFTITANGLTGNVKLSGSNVSLSTSQTWVEKNSVTITAKVTGFPASVTATPVELTDNEYNIVSLSPRTIQISQKQAPAPPPSQNNSGNNQGQGNSGGQTNSGQNGSSGQTSSQGQSNGGGQKSSQGQSNSGGQTSSQGWQSNSGSQTSSQRQSNNRSGTQQGSGELAINNGTKSSNNYLKNLQVNIGTLSPDFYRETYEYTVDNIIEEQIEITAEAEDEKAIINGTGSIALNGGENRINIEVIAENEQARTYTIIVNKIENVVQSDVRLSALQIQTINENNMFEDLDIGFDKEKLEYETTVEDDVTDLSVLATVEREGIIVEIDGEKNLKEGENIVTITLTKQETSDNIAKEKTTYIIKVNRKAKPVVEVAQNKLNTNQLLAIFIVVAVAVGLIAIAITTHIRKNKASKITKN